MRYGKKRPCKCMRRRKRRPYGQISHTGYCSICDVGMELKISKRSVRHKAKISIKKELKDEP